MPDSTMSIRSWVVLSVAMIFCVVIAWRDRRVLVAGLLPGGLRRRLFPRPRNEQVDFRLNNGVVIQVDDGPMRHVVAWLDQIGAKPYASHGGLGKSWAVPYGTKPYVAFTAAEDVALRVAWSIAHTAGIAASDMALDGACVGLGMSVDLHAGGGFLWRVEWVDQKHLRNFVERCSDLGAELSGPMSGEPDPDVVPIGELFS